MGSNVKNKLNSFFPSTNENLMQLVTAMLEFNPLFRPSASELLTSKYFDDIRLPQLEQVNPMFLQFTFDDPEKREHY